MENYVGRYNDEKDLLDDDWSMNYRIIHLGLSSSLFLFIYAYSHTQSLTN